MARSFTGPVTGSSSTIITLENPSPSSSSQHPQQTLVLRLSRRPSKKKVTWKEGTVDNEFLNKKSSKKCCMFHKQKPFDEDDSEDEDHDHDHHPKTDGHDQNSNKDGASTSGCCSSAGH
ncbi:inhibitor-3 [Tasmannia lanceolata]|uniref:inhibitor-3 n=1 Tax=Tasmannia lanceolata TaxID=3420 RepID=UPI004063799D